MNGPVQSFESVRGTLENRFLLRSAHKKRHDHTQNGRKGEAEKREVIWGGSSRSRRRERGRKEPLPPGIFFPTRKEKKYEFYPAEGYSDERRGKRSLNHCTKEGDLPIYLPSEGGRGKACTNNHLANWEERSRFPQGRGGGKSPFLFPKKRKEL